MNKIYNRGCYVVSLYFKKYSKVFYVYWVNHDFVRRLKEHNEGMNQSTKHYAPIEIKAYITAKTEIKGRELEKYFKTSSGKAVLKKRILSAI